MIKFLKKLFSKKEENKTSKFKREKHLNFTATLPEEIFLINQGFIYSSGNLIKEKDNSTITYNLENKIITIHINGGTIVLPTEGNKDKIERFYKKYFINQIS